MPQHLDQTIPQDIGRDSMLAALALVEAAASGRHDDVRTVLETSDPHQLVTGLLSTTKLLFGVVAERTGVPAAALIAQLRGEVLQVRA